MPPPASIICLCIICRCNIICNICCCCCAEAAAPPAIPIAMPLPPAIVPGPIPCWGKPGCGAPGGMLPPLGAVGAAPMGRAGALFAGALFHGICALFTV